MRSLLVLAALAGAAIPQTPYRKAPDAIRQILDAAPLPTISVNPPGDHALLIDRELYPPIARVSQPMLRLAGHRINPRTNGAHLATAAPGLTLISLNGTKKIRLAFPAGARILPPEWNQAGDRFAMGVEFSDRIELWLGETATGEVRAVKGVRLNAALGDPLTWGTHGRVIYARAVPPSRGAVPTAAAAPEGPNVQESKGRASDTWTFQDMLASSHDEDLFEFYATSQLVRIDAESGAASPIGRPAIYESVDPSPDGRHLLISHVHRPFSWLVPSSRFPAEIEVWTISGQRVHTLASLPLADSVNMDGVRTGPRQVRWKPGEPATLVWVEALDGGNPKEKAPHRDRVMMAQPPFDKHAEWRRVEHRFSQLLFGASGESLLTESNRDRRWTRSFLQAGALQPGGAPRVFDDRSTGDRYRNPGSFVTTVSADGQRVIRRDGDFAFLEGDGATPTGERPFLDRVNLRTLEKQRLFHSEEGVFEQVIHVLDAHGSRLLTRRESPTEPPNYFIRENGKRTAITDLKDPAAILRGATQKLVTYKRADGVPLSFTLYLPPGYKQGTRLATIFYAYPLEFNDASTASQVSTTANRFTFPFGASHLFLLLHGYAILNNASLPVVGDLKVANNTYIEQIVAGAKAAIDKAVELGVTDPDRVGATGHSYGGFMTANLLAHSDLFRAGVARSGAYNRTLTPFGFQGERRNFWEASDIYFKMSPFIHANKIKEPILFIHGEADNNSGTYPIQSQRMFQAVRGNGGVTKLVMLPHESHAYAARESIEHVIAETIAWFDEHVKNAPPRANSTGD
jgi:dipeptidyl aminopeptidase/acylaminoacyl peptidase